ncbi:MAG TPA: molybdopterin-dependent oxidoreductase [Puia sp.]|nr:molybdopterin-dependent oxidoreductase [Puia sp.]
MAFNHRHIQHYSSICCYCGVGCGVTVSKDKKGRIAVEGSPEYPVNKGQLCSKGMNLHHTVNDRSDRLLFPQMRPGRGVPFRRVGWDVALNRATAVWKTLIARYGADSVGFYVSGQCLTEEYYVINKLMKGFIGSNNIDSNSRLCMSSAVAAHKLAFGEDSVPVCYEDIELTDCLLVAGANPAWCHPILWRRVEAHKAAHPGVKIIVADPRRTDSCAVADLHLPLRPGTDITLNHAIGRLLIERGAASSSFISEHTEGYHAYRERVFARSVAEAAAVCGLEEGDIRLAAEWIGSSGACMSLWTMGLNQSASGVNKVLSLIDLHLLTGQIGRPGAGPFSLTGQPNAMGGREVGGLANLLPAHRELGNAAHRENVQRFWGSGPLAAKPGLTATEMFDALADGRMKAIWIIGTNPLVSLPDARTAEAALRRAKFVIVQEVSNRPETLAFADLVLPAAAWTEKQGTMTNSERRISLLDKVLDPPGEALPDAEIICKFAALLGFPGFNYADPAAIFREHALLTAGTSIDISGLDYTVLRDRRSVQWPYPKGRTDGGTCRLFVDRRFPTASGRAMFHAVPDDIRSEKPDPAYPFILTTGRIRDQWHTMTKTGKVNKLKQHMLQAFLEINPEDAGRLGIADGAIVVVSSRRGEVRVPARLAETIRQGVVFLPMHWGKLLDNDLNRANNLTQSLLDPVSKEPDFKYSAVQVAKYKKTRERIVIVGAGAGSHGFVRSFRALNDEDELIVFNREDQPFYNRVLLPDYISGARQWEQLVRMTREEESALGVTLHRGVSIEKIDRAGKSVTDSRGIVTHYDKLILATGSRAALPRQVPSLDGIFTLRSRADADRFRSRVGSGSHVIVAGGGLLGLELAASLREMDIRVSIVHRSSRFLDRQLDPLGSQLLHEEIIDQGCEVYYSDEVQLFNGQTKFSGVRLRSGRVLEGDALVFAIGTVPNIEIARDAGLEYRRGVVVDGYLRTSDPHIHAVGEIAEFNGGLYGFTAAAEEQAEILARYLHGDIASHYGGTVPMNIIKIHGFDLCSIGIPESPDSREYEEIVFIDRARRHYKKCIIHQDRLVGTILIGDKEEFREFREWITRKTELSDKRLQLLRNGSRAEPIQGRLICSCNNVGSGNLVKKVGEGCRELTELCAATGAGTGCGSCRPEVKKILEEALADV